MVLVPFWPGSQARMAVVLAVAMPDADTQKLKYRFSTWPRHPPG